MAKYGTQRTILWSSTKFDALDEQVVIIVVYNLNHLISQDRPLSIYSSIKFKLVYVVVVSLVQET